MQRIMIEKLNCKDWNEVQTHHPTTSHHSTLERFIFLFKSGVSVQVLFAFGFFKEICSWSNLK